MEYSKSTEQWARPLLSGATSNIVDSFTLALEIKIWIDEICIIFFFVSEIPGQAAKL
mgnify:CR=1 FL=1